MNGFINRGNKERPTRKVSLLQRAAYKCSDSNHSCKGMCFGLCVKNQRGYDNVSPLALYFSRA